MIGKLFLDTNVVLDIILRRDGEDDVRRIIDFASHDQFRRLYVSYLSMANMAFVLRKTGADNVRHALHDTMEWCNVLYTDDMQVLSAIKNGSPDFEDALQIACAEIGCCDVIITRNTEHFKKYTEIPVVTPAEFVSHCGH